MASTYLGGVGEFSSQKETFRQYVERMQMFFIANDIVEPEGADQAEARGKVKLRKKAIFLAEIGAEHYTTLSNLLAPEKPADKALDEIIAVLEKHYNPTPLEITESFHFGTRNQQQGESVSEYIVALKKLSIHCNYGEFLTRALRDRFVCGLNDTSIQNKLLNASDLTFQKACEMANAMEMAGKQAKDLRSNAGAVQHVSRASVKSQGRPTAARSKSREKCHRCGGAHSPETCVHKTSTCNKCKRVGHIYRECRTVKNEQSKNSQKNYQKQKRAQRPRHVQAVSQDVDSDQSEEEFGIYSVVSVIDTEKKMGFL